jgi:hypothetical protein
MTLLMKRAPAVKTLVGILGLCFFEEILPRLSAQQADTVNEALVQEVSQAMDAPATITRRNGSRFAGRFDYGTPDGVVLSQRVDGGGVVEVPFSWTEILSVELPGKEWLAEIEDAYGSANHRTVVATLEAVYPVWSGFFPVLEESERMRFLMLADSLIHIGRYESALGLLRSLAETTLDKQPLGRVVDLQLIACLQLGLHPEAFALAVQRIERSADASEATLAWIAIAVHHLAHKRYRQAWMAAVHPLVFDRRSHAPELSDAYLIAMVSTLKLNLPGQALNYHEAFIASGLDMRENPHTRDLLAWFQQVDWDAIRLDPVAGMEPYIDLQAEVPTTTGIAVSDIPVMPIPLRQP